ncbi:hypothetical protein DVH05_017185 [Phytophthora capsici]|nr:hypothetical protein DVH05_017185 [Phytophthora capsici]
MGCNMLSGQLRNPDTVSRVMVTRVSFHFNMVRQVVMPHSSAEEEASGGQEGEKDGVYWSRLLVVPSRSRQISRLWLENALVLTDGVQIFALMWLSQPWPWPARWPKAPRWTNVS